MADNRVSFFAQKLNWQLGFDNSSPKTLQQARVESQRFRDQFRANLQDTATNANADESIYRVSNIQEIAKVASGSNYVFAHAFIIRQIDSNKEWMVIYNLPTFHFTTGAWNTSGSYPVGGILNGATAGWTSGISVYYSFNSGTPYSPPIDTYNYYTWQEYWIIPNNDYATSTFGGSWEFPTYATAYTLDFIRAASFGANVISGDPASSGPNPVTAGAGNFDAWWPANWSTKNYHIYSNYYYDSSQTTEPMTPALNYWVFDKVEKGYTCYSWHPHAIWRMRITQGGEVFDTFANGGLANVADTKQDALIVMDVNLGVTNPDHILTNSQNLRRCHGFRGDGTTRDSAMILALNGDRVYNNYKNGSNEIFTRKVNVSNGFTTKGFIKPEFMLEGGPNTTSLSVKAGYNATWLLNKILEYPDADNPMLWTGCPYFTMWKKNLGGVYGLSMPGLP